MVNRKEPERSLKVSGAEEARNRIGAIIEKYEGFVVHLCRQSLDRREDIQDQVQETFLRAIRHLQDNGLSYRSEGSLIGLLKICAVCALSEFWRTRRGRGRKRRPRMLEVSSLEQNARVWEEHGLAEQLFLTFDDDRNGEELLMVIVVKGGNELGRAVKLLWDGYSRKEVAGELGISERTVYRWLEKALQITIETRAAEEGSSG